MSASPSLVSANSPEKNLTALGITLPVVSKPAANYVPYVIAGNQVIISGQLPFLDGKIADEHKGRLGEGVSIEQAQKTAQVCGLNILGHLKAACDGDLSKVSRCLRLGVFVSSAPDFTQQPTVANGVSDLMANVFGEQGQHARAAVGVNQLPFGAAVEVEALFELKA
ncbi:MAG: RidA family protein [Rickettsiales bacterium]|nr:RidA family protein [Rickettsiales bacterium]